MIFDPFKFEVKLQETTFNLGAVEEGWAIISSVEGMTPQDIVSEAAEMNRVCVQNNLQCAEPVIYGGREAFLVGHLGGITDYPPEYYEAGDAFGDVEDELMASFIMDL